MKRIPKGFQMGPHWVSVAIVSDEEMRAVCKETDTKLGLDGAPNGLAVFAAYKIYVKKVGKDFPKQSQLHTFWHEYFHMLLWCVGRERLSRDEVLVDNCGAMHLQAIQSAEF
jgi:hypothetical protein